MFKQFFDAFWPKAVNCVAEQGLNSVLNIKNYKQILENLQKNLMLLSAKAVDVKTEIKNAEDSGRKKRKREVEEWLEEVKEIEKKVDALGSEAKSKGFIMRFLDGGKAAQLNGKVEKLFQQRLNFGEPVLDARGRRGESLLTDEMVGVAFKENLETVLKIMEDRQDSMIGLYGMGGVGKTTLAKHVYNQLVREYEGRVVWVTVSQEFTIKSLQDKIARFLGVKLEDEDEEAFRAATLNRFLSQKKTSVLILDDVWENIDMKRVGCNFAVECCRLIVTTRSAEVCRRIGCKKLIPVVKLGKYEAWKLFTKTLDNARELGPEVEKIAKSMVEMCDGLPLGIITLAGSMKGETAIGWKTAATELKYCVTGQQNDLGEVDEMFKVLKYSFDRLKMNCQSESNEFNRFQLCFLYCSLYPEDYAIVRDDLVRKFISEGLVDERSRRSQAEQGHFILDKLVNLCLLETCVNYKNFECVKMHDLVRSMALKICKGKYMVRAGEWSLKEIPNQEEWTKDLEKVSLVQCGIFRIGGVSPDCPKLLTLLLWGNILLKFIPSSFFSKMQGLCTLDLCGNHEITKLPNSVSELKSLKSLLLENCIGLEYVPNLGRLKALKVLNLSRTAIEKVPQGLEELCKLRFFSIDAPRLKLFPKGLLLKLGHLEHLNLPFHLRVEIEEMENLKQLEEFGGGVKNVSDFNLLISLGTCCYSIVVSKNSSRRGIGLRKLEDLGCKNNELVLCESNVRDENVLGKGIAYLKIGKCEGLSQCFVDDLAARFGNPTSLKKLQIEYCGGIECIWRSDLHGVGLQASQISGTLEEIQLEGLDDLKGVVMMQRGEIGASTIAPAQLLVSSSLKKLLITNCNKMRKVGLPVLGVPNLEHITISHCGEIEKIFDEDEGTTTSVVTTLILPKLKMLSLSKLPKLRKVRLSILGVSNLEKIEIEHCEDIEEIFEDEGRDFVTTLLKLQWLTLRNLPRLKKVGLLVSELSNLQEISIWNCGEIKEIFKEEDEGRAASILTTLPKLKKLYLREMLKLKKVGLAASVVPNIEHIKIWSCEEIEEIFKEDEGRDAVPALPKLINLVLTKLPRLRKLGLPLSRAPNLKEIFIWDCGIEEIFEEDEGRDAVTALPKLKELKLTKLPRLRKLGLPQSRAPNLEKVSIEECGIEEIFEEDEGRDAVTALPKLEELKLTKLPRLRKLGLPLSRAPNLEKFSIEECGIEEIFEGRDAATALPKLKELKLTKLPRLRKLGLPQLRAPNLEKFSIEECGIEEIFEEDEGRDAATALPKLKELKLTKLPRLRKLGLPLSRAPNLEKFSIEECGIEEIFEEDEGRDPVTTFSKIQILELCKLPRVKKLGLPASAHPNLRRIHITDCGEIEVMFEDEGRDAVATVPKLEELRLSGNPRLRKVGLAASGVPNLKRIDISDCGEIEEMFEDEGRDVVATLPKLKELRLSGNPRLRKVGLAALGVPNLKKIFIRDCGEIEEILKEEDEGRAASIVTTLHKFRSLTLEKCPRLRSVSNATMICNSIKIMCIEKCPRLMNKLLVDMTVAPPPSLTYLRVDREWWESLEWDRPELPRLFQSIPNFMFSGHALLNHS